MATASKRRWFRYSLRTMFVVVTLLAVWLGYHVNWIRQREKLLAEWQESGGWIVDGPPPWQIRMLGAKGVEQFQCRALGQFWDQPEALEAFRQRSGRLFPESYLTELKLSPAGPLDERFQACWPGLSQNTIGLFYGRPKSVIAIASSDASAQCAPCSACHRHKAMSATKSALVVVRLTCGGRDQHRADSDSIQHYV